MNTPAERRESYPGIEVQDSTADSTSMDTDSEEEEPESIEEVARIQKEMQELGQRVWGSRLKSFQLKNSKRKDTRGGAAPAYNTDRSSTDEGMEAPCEDKPAVEVTPRIKDQ